MYLKETLIRVLKVKNVILLILGIFLVSTSVAILLELIVQYFGDWFTILHARATPECVIFIALGNIMIAYSRISRRLINDAGFYASYFEGSLSGYISLSACILRASARTAAVPTSLPRSFPATGSTVFQARRVRASIIRPFTRDARSTESSLVL